jgi:hypothetical protein
MTIWIGSRSQIWSTPSGFDMEPKKNDSFCWQFPLRNQFFSEFRVRFFWD